MSNLKSKKPKFIPPAGHAALAGPDGMSYRVMVRRLASHPAEISR